VSYKLYILKKSLQWSHTPHLYYSTARISHVTIDVTLSYAFGFGQKKMAASSG